MAAQARDLDADDRDRRHRCARAMGSAASAQDEYALESQRRTAAAQQAGRFDDEIVPLPTTKKVVDKDTKAESFERSHAQERRGQPARHHARRPCGARSPCARAAYITAGNASQLSDGASACVVMDAKLAEKTGLKPLGIFRGFAVAGCEPDEMGIGPVFAVPKLLAAPRPQDGRHRPVGAERGLREPGALLPRPARHSRRSGSTSTAARSRSAIPTA